jgi:CspA family cold shock protein
MSATATTAPASNGRIRGVVKWFKAAKGYGFIQRSDRKGDIFVHFSGIAAEGYRSLEPEQIVEFDVTTTEKGAQAVNVTVISTPAAK